MITRFAPSPTGYLHLGHAYAAGIAREAARRHGGRFLLRWEDIDQTRCHPRYESATLEDLAWLGYQPEGQPARQSERFSIYEEALDSLRSRGLVYPCFCTRRDIREEIENADAAPHGPDGPLYPGTCRQLSADEAGNRIAEGRAHAWRLRMDAACQAAGSLPWHDLELGEQVAQPEQFGDVILARKDTPTSYHLAVTIDDAAQGITLVTRGVDLFAATHIHRLLQALLNLPVPQWHHHRLIRDANGRRLAKRDAATTLRHLRDQGVTAEEIRVRLKLPPLSN